MPRLWRTRADMSVNDVLDEIEDELERTRQLVAVMRATLPEELQTAEPEDDDDGRDSNRNPT